MCTGYKTNSLIFSFLLSLLYLFNQNVCFAEKELKETKVDPSLYAEYRFSRDDKVLDFGTQPYGVMTTSTIIEYMFHDPILKEELEAKGFSLREHKFLKGSDLNQYMRSGDLEIGVSGDMPAIRIACEGKVGLLSAFKGEVAIVSKDIREVEGLKGKKVGYAYGSNAHYFLLRTLDNYKIPFSKIKLLPMDITHMSEMLNRNVIDAYATWEFTPPTTMRMIQNKVTVSKGITHSFFYLRKEILAKHPEIAYLLLASQIRAMNWLSTDEKNGHIMADWLYKKLTTWGQKDAPLSIERIVRHIKEARFYLNQAVYPLIPVDQLTEFGNVYNQFHFLIAHDFLSSQTVFSDLTDNIRTEFLRHVLTHPQEFRLYEKRILLDSE